MAKNVSIIPYTELVERAQEISRIPDNARKRVRGTIQDVYTREIPTKFDWKFLIVGSTLTTIEQYNTGTVSANTGDTSVTFSSDASVTGFSGRKIKINGDDTVYTITVDDATGATIRPSFQGNSNASGNGYIIFQPVYPLARDFDRLLKNGSMYKWTGGQKDIIPEESYQEYIEDYQSTPSTPEKVRLVEEDTAGVVQVEFGPPPKDARNYGYDYIKQVRPLEETSAGTCTITASSRTVTASTDAKFTDATTGDWFRVSDLGTHQDSSWYQIIAIAHASSLTLNTVFANTGVTNANYVISRAPEFPARLHPGVLFGAVRQLTLDQTDESFGVYHVKFAEVLSDAKTIHVSRVYNQKIGHLGEDYLYRR